MIDQCLSASFVHWDMHQARILGPSIDVPGNETIRRMFIPRFPGNTDAVGWGLKAHQTLQSGESDLIGLVTDAFQLAQDAIYGTAFGQYEQQALLLRVRAGQILERPDNLMDRDRTDFSSWNSSICLVSSLSSHAGMSMTRK